MEWLYIHLQAFWTAVSTVYALLRRCKIPFVGWWIADVFFLVVIGVVLLGFALLEIWYCLLEMQDMASSYWKVILTIALHSIFWTSKEIHDMKVIVL